MGFSYTNKAGQVLDQMTSKDGPSNEVKVGVRRFFWEVDRVDQPDGGIKGSIYEIAHGMAEHKGRFHIDGKGVIKAPLFFRKAYGFTKRNGRARACPST